MSTYLHVREMRSLGHMQSHSGRQFLNQYFLFWKICQTLHTVARVCMINKKQLFHEMLGGERVLSLWDPTIPLILKFLLINRKKKWGGEKRRNMLATEWKISGDSHPDVKKRKQKTQKKTNLPPALFLFYHVLLLALDFGLSGWNSLPVLHLLKVVWRGAALQDVVIHLSEV